MFGAGKVVYSRFIKTFLVKLLTATTGNEVDEIMGLNQNSKFVGAKAKQ